MQNSIRESATESPAEGAPASPVNPDHSGQAARFLEFIFGGMNQGFVEIHRLTAGRRPKLIGKPLLLPLPLDLARMRDQLPGGDTIQVAVGLAPRCRVPRGGKPGKDYDVIRSGCVWANISYKQRRGGIIEAVRAIKEFPLRPSIVVNSGNSRQVYFIIDPPLSDAGLLVWEELTRDLGHAFGASGAVAPSGVHLVPGYFNLAEPEHPQPCLLDEDHSSWVRYTPDELMGAIKKAQNGGDPAEAADGSQVQVSLATMRERGLSSDLIKAIITGRCSLPGRSRFDARRDYHERDLWIASSLLDNGFGREEVKAVFRSHPHGCGDKWAGGKRGEDYLELTVRTASTLRRTGRPGGLNAEGQVDEGDQDLPPGYELSDDGSLWFNQAASHAGGREKKPVKVADSFLRISQIQEDVDSGQVRLAIEYTYLRQTRRRTILRAQMADSRQIVSALAGEGAPVTSNNARLVTSYLAAYEHSFGPQLPRKKITSRFGRGRADGPFLFPGVSSDVEFTATGPGEASLLRAFSSRRGTLPAWVEVMKQVGGERLIIPQAAVLSSFVPPLQGRLQIPNFIFDISGSTSSGKSTSLRIAASAYGRPDDPDSSVLQWMNTRAAIEQVAGMCSGLPLFLDDAQHCPEDLKRGVVYMIGNGRGKGRAVGYGAGMNETPSWHTVALSTSEEPLYESSRHEGARGRILSVGGAVPPFPHGSGAFVQSLEHAVAHNHGYAGEVYIRHLNGLTGAGWGDLQRRYSTIRAGLLRESATNLAGRVSGYIAAIHVAGEIACPLLGIPFHPDVVCSWLMLHLAEQQSTQNQVLSALRLLADYYVRHQESFGSGDDEVASKSATILGALKRGVYVGFLRSTLDAVFRQHRWSQTAVLHKMAEAGVLIATESDRHTKKVSLGGVKHRMVCVKWTALFPDEAGGDA
jgi:hypothetical protein